MFCPRCGKELSGNESFCTECGLRFAPQDQRAPYPKRKEVFLLSFIAGAALAFALTFLVNYMFLFLFVPFVFFWGAGSGPWTYVFSGGALGIAAGTLLFFVLRTSAII